MKRAWQTGIIISLLFALTANFLTGAQILDLPSIGQISDKYATLLTPAGYAFSIWSLIYASLIVLAVYQARDFFSPHENNDLPQQLGLLFIISNICNGLWTFIFVKEWVGLSVVILLLLTASLYLLIRKLHIATYDAPAKVIVYVWWPLLVYTGWVTVASIVNIASWLRSTDTTLTPVAASIVLGVVTAGLLVLLQKRNVRELLLASAWGVAAIGVQQINATVGSRLVSWTAFGAAATLFMAVLLHAYKNRHKSIFAKLKE